MRFSIKSLVISIVFVYFILYFLNHSFANFILALLLVCFVPILLLYKIFVKDLYKHSINMVEAKYISGENTISNSHCTVKYTPADKIIVMEKIAINGNKRLFTIYKNQLNIDRAWNQACKIFDDYTTIDLLCAFYGHETSVNMLTIESKSKPVNKVDEINIEKSTQKSSAKSEFVEMSSVRPDDFGADFAKQNEFGSNFVEMDSIKPQQEYNKQKQQEEEFVGFNDIMSKYDKKIDVNNVEAGELAILPGINIIKAKKIIEYRNQNGLFKSEQEFIDVADVKDHFINQIRKMIVIGTETSGNKPQTDDTEGRIIDF